MGNFREVSGLSAASLNAFLVPSTDVSSFKWYSLHVNAIGSGVTLTFQGSNDNLNFAVIETFNTLNSLGMTTTANATGIYAGPLQFRYLAVQQTAWSSGITTGVLELYETPAMLYTMGVQAQQFGNWNVGVQGVPNNATQVNNSATGTNAAAAATLTGTGGRFTYLTGFELDSSGAVAAATTATITGVVGGTLTYEIPTSFTNKIVEFANMPLQSSAQGVNIVVTLGALGTGIIGSVNAHGYTL